MLLSTVIPLYNAAPWLEKAVVSVIDAGLPAESHEIIIVDDGSTDGSSDLADALAGRWPGRVRAVHKPNGGVSSARNCGIEESRGEYVHFMDADDWIIPGLYSRLRDDFLMLAPGCPDYLGFGSVTLDGVMRRRWVETLSLEGDVTFDGAAREYYASGRYLPFPVMGWYRREFLERNSLRFDTSLSVGEDVAFNFAFARCNPRLRLTSIVGYRYEVREGSAVSSRSPEKMRRVVEGYLRTLAGARQWSETDPDLRAGIDHIIGREMVSMTSRLLSAGYSTAELRDMISRLREARLLPVAASGLRTTRPINLVLSSPVIARAASAVYRRLFVPYVLPRLSRN